MPGYSPDPLLEVDDLCECGHPGYDGHDMRDVPPRCLTPGCYCGLTARCGSTEPHGAHRFGPRLGLGGWRWCGGNLNVIIGQP